jgi:methylmalonyl-CoA/ethylmalonyl-CoA epimerase
MTWQPPLHHVGIVSPSEEEALALMALLGLEEDYRGFVPQWSALCIFTKPNGASPIEFVVPDGGPLARFNKGAGGLHHIALQVPDLDALAARLEAEDMKLLEVEHVKGAGDFLCNFLSPVYTRGVTVEFVQLLSATGGGAKS